ncbi:MAG: hypothetical protein JSR96_15265 [Proteobacteria bacterium]|nr:hypothetical protein [Pseudomonadota bacterium]
MLTDDARSAVVLSIVGTAKPDFGGDPADGYAMTIPYAGSYPPPERKRPADQDQTTPWATDFPSYVCSIANIRLPRPSASRWAWAYRAKAFDTQIGGIRYARKATLADGVMRTVRIYKTLKPELSAADAGKANGMIDSFDNSMGEVFKRSAKSPPLDNGPSAAPVPPLSDIDATAEHTVCSFNN